MIDPVQVAWAAGVLEGEGCFSLHQRSNRPNSLCRAIHCEMTDEDVVRRLHTIFSVGTVILRENMDGRKDGSVRKQTWIWSVQNKTGVRLVLEAILPHLGERRKLKALVMLNSIEGIVE